MAGGRQALFRSPGMQLYLSLPREFVETKQRRVNTINIYALAYSAADEVEEAANWSVESRRRTKIALAERCCQGLNTFIGYAPLSPQSGTFY